MFSVSAGLAGRTLRIMFYDEARFGRLPVLRAAWCPHGELPLIRALAVQREYKYIYGFVSLFNGTMDWMEAEMINTENMNIFLGKIGNRYPDEYILMVLEGASSHKAKSMGISKNIHILALPPFCPELNPVEHLWGYLRRTACRNRCFGSLARIVEAVVWELDQLGSGLRSAVDIVSGMFCWSWMISSSRKVNWKI